MGLSDHPFTTAPQNNTRPDAHVLVDDQSVLFLAAATDATASDAMVAEEEREIQAPQCNFRCNRSRMMLTIRVTLHHVGADHINLKTSRKKIVLDTLKSRRKFKLSRAYPRGIECDDSQTSAKLERGALVVEMPITKLPSITTDQQPAASASGGSSSTKAEKRKKSAAPEADGPAERSAKRLSNRLP